MPCHSITSKLALPYCREAFILLKTHRLRKLNWFLYYVLLLMKCAYIQFHNTYPMNQYFMLLGGKTAFHCFSLFLFNILLPLYSELLAQEKSLDKGKWLILLFCHICPVPLYQPYSDFRRFLLSCPNSLPAFDDFSRLYKYPL